MKNTAAFGPARAAMAVAALIAFAAIAVFLRRSLDGHLWLDELLTLTLLRADSLPRLWAGIVIGIDGNPPLYLTLAWLLSHALPSFVSSVAALKLANVAATVAGTLVLGRVFRRVASPLACWAGIFLLAALNDNAVYVALELRTYALYFALAAFAMLFQQRAIENHRKADRVALAFIYAALALAHTFGIVYVLCIAVAGWLSDVRGGRRPILFTAGPAVLVFACWLPFFIQQSVVGRPYIWIGPPVFSDLLQSIFSSPTALLVAAIELCCIAGVAIRAALEGRIDPHSIVRDERYQPHRYLMLLFLAMLGFASAVWTVSVLWFPMFVFRYFTPQLMLTFAIHVAFLEAIARIGRRHLPNATRRFAAAAAIIIAPALFSAVLLSKDPLRGQAPCADAAGGFFENDFARGDLPIIAESPHVFLPRSVYAPRAAAYRFPLDWEVVLNYPKRATGNATDFHVMENLRSWAGIVSIMPTDDIVTTYPEFLVIEQSGRAWFHNLRTTRDVAAEKLAETTGGDACTLWKVTSVKPRRSSLMKLD